MKIILLFILLIAHLSGVAHQLDRLHNTSFFLIKLDNYTYRKLIRAAIFLLPTLGVMWIFGVLAANSEHVAFAWIFTILNSVEVNNLTLYGS